MAWTWLMLAGVCEVIWAAGLKKYGFSLTAGGVFTVVMMVLSFILLQEAMKTLPLGTSYAVWTGIGAVGSVLWGMIMLNEPRDLPRMVCLMLIVGGIVGLKVMAPGAK